MVLFSSALLLVACLVIVGGLALTKARVEPDHLLALGLLFFSATLMRRLAPPAGGVLASFARFTHRTIKPALSVMLAYLAFLAVDDAGGPAIAYLVMWLGVWLFVVVVTELSSEAKVVTIDLFLPGDIRRDYTRKGRVEFWRAMFSRLDWHTLVLVVAVVDSRTGLVVGVLALTAFVPVYLQVFRAFPRIVKALLGKDVEEIEAFIRTYQPEVIIYCSGASGSTYQLNQWTSVLERCEKRVLVLIRELHFLNGLNRTTLPIAYMRSISCSEKFVTPQTKIVLYPANGQKNAQMFRMTSLTHVFINHGESDKIVNVSKFLRCYDRLYVAGQMAMDRTQAVLGMANESFAMIGRPQAELSLRVVTTNPPPDGQWTLLYAPTWEGFTNEANYTSVSTNALSALSPLLNHPEYRVLFKSHPYTGSVKSSVREALSQLNSAFQAASNVQIFDSSKNIHELMNESDILLTDVSSVMNDYLFTEKPIVLTNARGLSKVQCHAEFPTSAAAYILRKDMSDLAEKVAVVRKDDVLREKRLQVKTYSLGSWPQGSMRRFIEQLEIDCRGTPETSAQ